MAKKPNANSTSTKQKSSSHSWKVFAALTDWPVITLAIVLAVLSLGLWWWNRDTVPKEIVIAAGPKNQAYERAGNALQETLQSRLPKSRVSYDARPDGSPQNAAALSRVLKIISSDGASELSADIGIVQERDLAKSGQQGIVAGAPLFHAVVCVAINAKELGGIGFRQMSPEDPEYQTLVSRILRENMANELRVSAGGENSGTRRAARIIGNHYRSGVNSQVPQNYGQPHQNAADDSPAVADLASDEIIRVRQTAWLDEETLEDLRQNNLELVSIDAAALAQQSEFDVVTIPAGAYGYDKLGERIPRHDITTIGSTDFIAVRSNASEALVTNILDAIYSDPIGFADKLNETRVEASRPPIQLISQTEILSRYLNSSFHPTAQAYYQPFDPSELATWTEFLAGSKDLLVAFAAGVFLLYGLRVRMERRREEAKMSAEKEVLDEYLEKTIQLEGEQWNCRDPEKLEKILAEITAIKIEALHKLSHEDLRSDRAFSIFLMQCANVINKVQMKILAYRGGPPN